MVFGVLRLPVDYIAALSAFILAYYLRPITDLIPGKQYYFFPEQLPVMGDYLRLAFWSSGFLILLFAVGNLYSLKITERFSKELLKIFFFVSAWLMGIIAYYFLIAHQLFFSRIALAHIWFFTLLFVASARLLIVLLQSLLLRLEIGRRRLLFVGVSDLADQFYFLLKKDRHYQVVGALASKLESRKQEKLKIIGTLQELETIVKKYKVEEIIQAESDPHDEHSQELLSFCRSHQIHYHFIPDLVRLQRTNVEVKMFGEMPLISLKQTPLEGWGRVWKHLFDFSLSLIFIVLLTPVWIVISILIKLDSPGSAFYKSRRQYRDKHFNVYKFRSMVADADFRKKALLSQNERSEGPLFKIKNDPRITRFGRFLRKTSIDELPQIFNVLLGNMSLVGPRPHLPEEIEKYQAHHYEVFALKPGVTGLAQIKGRSNLDFEEEVKLDVVYIENWSLWLDLKILFKTIGIVFRGEGH